MIVRRMIIPILLVSFLIGETICFSVTNRQTVLPTVSSTVETANGEEG